MNLTVTLDSSCCIHTALTILILPAGSLSALVTQQSHNLYQKLRHLKVTYMLDLSLADQKKKEPWIKGRNQRTRSRGRYAVRVQGRAKGNKPTFGGRRTNNPSMAEKGTKDSRGTEQKGTCTRCFIGVRAVVAYTYVIRVAGKSCPRCFTDSKGLTCAWL